MFTLSKREKRLLQGLGTFVALLLLWTFIIDPYIQYQSKTKTESVSNKSKMLELEKIIAEYNSIKEKQRQYNTQLDNNKGVLSFAEEIAKNLGHKPYTSERDTKIKNKFKKFITTVKFESIGITALFKFIHSIENSNRLLRISNIHIRLALKGRDTYDVTMTIESLAK